LKADRLSFLQWLFSLQGASVPSKNEGTFIMQFIQSGYYMVTQKLRMALASVSFIKDNHSSFFSSH
jgi:hypothetical protein